MDLLYSQNLTDDTKFFFQLYNKCGVGHICVEMLISAGIRWLLTWFGLFANLSLVWISIRHSKKFNGATNRLLALCSFCDFCYLLCYAPPFFSALTGNNFIRLDHCFFLMAIPLFGLFSSILCSFFIGLDRLLSVLFPFKYKMKGIFLLASTSLTFLYAAYGVFYAYLVTSHNPDLPSVCGVSEVYFPAAVQMPLFRNNFLINFASLFLYLLLWLVLRREMRKSVVTENALATKRIFNGILAIVLTVLSMWLLTSFIYVGTYQIQSETVQWFVLPTISAGLSIVAASSNGPLLYWFNSDYRDALRKEAQWLLRLIAKQSNAVTVATNGVNHTFSGGHRSSQQQLRNSNRRRGTTAAGGGAAGETMQQQQQ